MGILSELKLTNVQRNNNQPPALRRRFKLAEKLHEQLLLAQANAEGKSFEVAKTRRIKNTETGVVSKVESMRRVRQWWFVAESGKVMLQIKYGTKVLELAKGKSSIEIATADKLISTIEQLKKAVLDGELDSQIEIALK